MTTSQEGSANIIAAVETFKRLAEIPSVSSAEALPCQDKIGAVDVRLTLSARSYATSSRTTQHCSLRVAGGEVVSHTSSPAVSTSDNTIKATFSSLPHVSTGRNVILRESSSTGDKERKRTVELWKGERCLVSVDVTKHHGAFNTTDTFASLSIHQDMVLYSAEANKPSREVDIISRKEGSGLQDWEYQAPLGEKFGGQIRPTVFLLKLHLQTGEGAKLQCLAVPSGGDDRELSSALLGQAVFSSSGKAIFLTAYPTLQDGRRLGIIYCSNRPAAIYRIMVEESVRGDEGDKDAAQFSVWTPQTWSRLSATGFSARSPRSKAERDTCFWLQSEEGGAHRDCDAIISSDESGKTREEIPIQSTPSKSSGWPGLFVDQLRGSCLLQKVGGMATDTIWGSRKTIVLHLFQSNSTPIDLTPLGSTLSIYQSEKEEEQVWSYTLLCTDGEDTIIASRSSPTQPQQILVGVLQSTARKVPVLAATPDFPAKPLYLSLTVTQSMTDIFALDACHSGVEEIEATQSMEEGDLAIQTVVLRSRGSSTDGPCILFPHGGPHSTFTTDWSPSNAALSLQGYTLIMPNYHGSLGRGQRFAHSLVGKCGQLDVDDCVKCVDHFVSTGLANRDKFYVQGGSHGGFLAVHLIGMFPTMFQRAVVRNPVVAAGIMEGTTDIPDWCYSEFGLDFFSSTTLSPHSCPSTIDYEILQRKSPVHQIEAIETPLLILLGLDDKRVPPSQSKMLYHRLVARGKTVRMLAFDGQDHALDGIECELIAWEASLRWLKG
ncbi:hypothetical protein CBS101457_003516 [Exobasidium rhododendri]|nr:hypothetical protein CBS101457_003516 [Exobasidium rhododendri]